MCRRETGIVQMSTCNGGPIRLVNAMRRLCGDQLGITASAREARAFRSRRPPSTARSARDEFCGFNSTFSIVKARRVPSGDQAGLKPRGETLLMASPVRPITNSPPPSRLDRNAMRLPSGENAGWSSSPAESAPLMSYERLTADALHEDVPASARLAGVDDPLPVRREAREPLDARLCRQLLNSNRRRAPNGRCRTTASATSSRQRPQRQSGSRWPPPRVGGAPADGL